MLRSDALEAVLEVASEQGGYVSSAQAAAVGLSRDDVVRLVRAGDLHRVRRGVLRMRHADSRHEDEIGAWLHFERGRLPWERHGRSEAVLSHDSAAGLRGLGSIVPMRPTVTVSPQRRRATGVSDIDVHGIPLADEDWGWLDADGVRLPVTTPARTVVDLLVDGAEPSYLRRAIVEATSRSGLTSDELLDTATRRRRRSQRLRASVEALLEAGG